MLRFLVIVIQPLRDEPQGLPRLQADIQDAFVVAMKAKLDLLEKVIPVVHARHTPRKEQVKEAEKAGGEDGGSDKIGKEDADNVVSLLMRILQFDLGFSDVWTARFRKVGEGIIASVVRLLVVSLIRVVFGWLKMLRFVSSWQMYGGAVATNGQLFPLILDTVAYLMDGALKPYSSFQIAYTVGDRTTQGSQGYIPKYRYLTGHLRREPV